MENLRKITELDVIESLENTEGLSIIANDNGQAKQIPASLLGGLSGGGGGVFIIDEKSSEFSYTDTNYGNKIKEAFLDGKTLYYFDGWHYFSVIAFNPEWTSGNDARIVIYVCGTSNTYDSIVNSTLKSYKFSITL